MPHDKSGQIIWHDLFSADRNRSMTFYGHVAGWSFTVEHATDFAWGGGETGFVLATLADEAGAGFIETPEGMSHGWIAYVEVPNVDSASKDAEKIGGEVVRAPFDVPGVGRNALVRDPLGALFGISQTQHAYPIPSRHFSGEIYLSGTSEFPSRFYSEIFGWSETSLEASSRGGAVISTPSGKAVAHHIPELSPPDARAMWLPCISVVDTATTLPNSQDVGSKPAVEMDFRKHGGVPLSDGWTRRYFVLPFGRQIGPLASRTAKSERVGRAQGSFPIPPKTQGYITRICEHPSHPRQSVVRLCQSILTPPTNANVAVDAHIWQHFPAAGAFRALCLGKDNRHTGHFGQTEGISWRCVRRHSDLRSDADICKGQRGQRRGKVRTLDIDNRCRFKRGANDFVSPLDFQGRRHHAPRTAYP